ncbi:MAG: GerAB/ArcD/ProY family transporter [Agathobacter sp.]|nr:GerAB/ArcD/ProY family transporter [Agathobacter sp.]
MFSNNKQISLRQTFRLFVFDLLGATTLILPGYLCSIEGMLGIVPVILGTLLAILFLFILYKARLIMKCDLICFLEQKNKRKIWEKVINKIMIISLFFYGICISGFYLYIFTDLIKSNLIPDVEYAIISGIIILATSYAVSGGLESRARVYEILFLFILILLLILTVFSSQNIKKEYLISNLTSGVLNTDLIRNSVKNTYFVFASYTTIFCSIFIPQKRKKHSYKHTEHLYKTIAISLLFSSLILVILYLDLIGNFGTGALSGMRFPIVTLIATISRFDSFMLTVWFFTMSALLNMHQYYTGKLLKSIVNKPGRIRYISMVAFVTYAISLALKYGDNIMNKYLNFLLYIGVPVLVLIPLVIIVTGCRRDELEDRCFPMLAALDVNEEDEITFEYRFPKVDGDKDKIMSKGAFDFEGALETYEQSLSKEPDTNHLKVMVIGKKFMEDKMQYSYFIELLKEKELFPRNTYVCVADDVNELLQYEDKIQMDIGSYLEEYIGHVSSDKKRKIVTLGDLMNESDNHILTLNVPYLTISSNGIVWDENYEVE